MPLDVLNQIDEAKQNVDPSNEKLLTELDSIQQKAKNSSESMAVLKEIVNGLTASGSNLSNSLQKVVFYFQRFEQKAKSARQSIFGLKDAYSNFNNSQGQFGKIINSLAQIDQMQQALGRGIKFASIDNVSLLTKQVGRLRNALKNMPSIPTNAVPAHSNAGKYTHGGQIPGHSTSGDKVPIWVNSGEYVLNKAQMSKLGRAIGGKSPKQVFQYASGRTNIGGSYKSGRQAFASGGLVSGGGQTLAGQIAKLSTSIDADDKKTYGVLKSLYSLIKQDVVTNAEFQKQFSEYFKRDKKGTLRDTKGHFISNKEAVVLMVRALKTSSKKFENQFSSIIESAMNHKGFNTHKKAYGGQLGYAMTGASTAMLRDRQIYKRTLGQPRERAKTRLSSEKEFFSLARILNRSNDEKAQGAFKNTLQSFGMKSAPDIQKFFKTASAEKIAELNEELRDTVDVLGDIQKQVSGFYGIEKRIGDDADDLIKKYASWLGGTPVGLAAVATGFAMIAGAIVKASDAIKNFIAQTSKLSRDYAALQQNINSLGSGIKLDSLRDELNLTREQALAMGQAFKSVAYAGLNDMSMVTTIAQNLKNALGEVDVTKLNEAVSILKDLPKNQVDVLVNGVGTMDDKANLIANLVQGGNLEKTIDLMVNGAFGDFDGTIQLSEKDKAIVQAINKSNKFVEDIKMGLYDWMPEWLSTGATWLSTGTKILGIIGGMVMPFWMTTRAVAKMAMASRGVAIQTMDISGGGGKLNGGMNVGNIVQGVGVGLATAAMGYAATTAVDKFVVESKNRESKRYDQRSREKSVKNAKKYHGIVDYSGQSARDSVKADAKRRGAEWASATNTFSKAAVGIAAAALTIGVAAGTITAGVGLVIGGAVAVVAGLAGLVAGWIGETSGDTEGAYKQKLVDRGDAYSTGGKYDEAENARAEKAMKPFMQYWEKNESIIKDQRSKMLKSMQSLNTHLKDIKAITDGKLTAFLRLQITANQQNLRSMNLMGGNKEDYIATTKYTMQDVTTAASIEIDAINKRRSRILKDVNMSEQQRAVAIAELKQKEIKVYERYQNAMNDLIGDYAKIPSIMLREMKAESAKAFAGLLNGNMMGNDVITSQNMQQIGSYTITSASQAFEKYTSDMKQIEESSAKIEKKLISATEELTRAINEHGMTVEQARQVEEELQEKRRKNLQTSGHADIAPIFAQLQQHQAKLLKVKQKKQRLKEGQSLSDEDYKIIQKSSQSLATLVRSNYDAFVKQFGKQFVDKNLLHNLDLNAKDPRGRDGNAIRAFSDMLSAFGARIHEIDKMSLSAPERRRLDGARKVLTANAAVQGAKNAQNSQQSLRMKATMDFAKAIQKSGKELANQLDFVFNSASKKFAESISEALRKSLDYRMVTGGVDEVSKNIDAQSKLLQASKQSFARSGEFLGKVFAESEQNLVKMMQSQNQTGPIRQYQELVLQLAQAQRYALANPQDTDAQGVALQLRRQLEYLSLDKTVADYAKSQQGSGFAALAGITMQGAKAYQQQRIEIQQKELQLVQSISDMVKKSLSAWDNQIARIQIDIAQQRVEQAEQTGDYGDIAGFLAKEQIQRTRESADLDVVTAEKGYRAAVERANAKYEEDMRNAKTPQDAKRARNMRDMAILGAQKELRDVRVKAIKDVAQSVLSATQPLLDRIDRLNQMNEINKDIANSLGLPFEHIIQLEQNMVDLARKKTDIERQRLEQMQKNGITGVALEKQKLAFAKAQANEIKMAFGAQRDALDKMLGKAMGSFTEMVGIFGPNGAMMNARKYGQGYMVNGAGMVVSNAGGSDMGMMGRNAYANAGPQFDAPSRHQWPTFATGGEIPGNSRSGDKILAFVNSGEWIFNSQQMNELVKNLGLSSQQQVFDLANGKKFAQGGRIGNRNGRRPINIKNAYTMSYDQAIGFDRDKFTGWKDQPIEKPKTPMERLREDQLHNRKVQDIYARYGGTVLSYGRTQQRQMKHDAAVDQRFVAERPLLANGGVVNENVNKFLSSTAERKYGFGTGIGTVQGSSSNLVPKQVNLGSSVSFGRSLSGGVQGNVDMPTGVQGGSTSSSSSYTGNGVKATPQMAGIKGGNGDNILSGIKANIETIIRILNNLNSASAKSSEPPTPTAGGYADESEEEGISSVGVSSGSQGEQGQNADDADNARALSKFGDLLSGNGGSIGEQKTKNQHDALNKILFYVKKIYAKMLGGGGGVYGSGMFPTQGGNTRGVQGGKNGQKGNTSFPNTQGSGIPFVPSNLNIPDKISNIRLQKAYENFDAKTLPGQKQQKFRGGNISHVGIGMANIPIRLTDALRNVGGMTAHVGRFLGKTGQSAWEGLKNSRFGKWTSGKFTKGADWNLSTKFVDSLKRMGKTATTNWFNTRSGGRIHNLSFDTIARWARGKFSKISGFGDKINANVINPITGWGSRIVSRGGDFFRNIASDFKLGRGGFRGGSGFMGRMANRLGGFTHNTQNFFRNMGDNARTGWQLGRGGAGFQGTSFMGRLANRLGRGYESLSGGFGRVRNAFGTARNAFNAGRGFSRVTTGIRNGVVATGKGFQNFGRGFSRAARGLSVKTPGMAKAGASLGKIFKPLVSNVTKFNRSLTALTNKFPKTTQTLGKFSKGVGSTLKILGTAATIYSIGQTGYDAYNLHKNGQYGKRDKAIGQGVGGLAGGFAGAKVGALIGSIGGPIGIAIGSILGGIVGSMAGSELGTAIAEMVGSRNMTYSDKDWAKIQEQAKTQPILAQALDNLKRGNQGLSETDAKANMQMGLQAEITRLNANNSLKFADQFTRELGKGLNNDMFRDIMASERTYVNEQGQVSVKTGDAQLFRDLQAANDWQAQEIAKRKRLYLAGGITESDRAYIETQGNRRTAEARQSYADRVAKEQMAKQKMANDRLTEIKKQLELTGKNTFEIMKNDKTMVGLSSKYDVKNKELVSAFQEFSKKATEYNRRYAEAVRRYGQNSVAASNIVAEYKEAQAKYRQDVKRIQGERTAIESQASEHVRRQRERAQEIYRTSDGQGVRYVTGVEYDNLREKGQATSAVAITKDKNGLLTVDWSRMESNANENGYAGRYIYDDYQIDTQGLTPQQIQQLKGLKEGRMSHADLVNNLLNVKDAKLLERLIGAKGAQGSKKTFIMAKSEADAIQERKRLAATRDSVLSDEQKAGLEKARRDAYIARNAGANATDVEKEQLGQQYDAMSADEKIRFQQQELERQKRQRQKEDAKRKEEHDIAMDAVSEGRQGYESDVIEARGNLQGVIDNRANAVRGRKKVANEIYKLMQAQGWEGGMDFQGIDKFFSGYAAAENAGTLGGLPKQQVELYRRWKEAQQGVSDADRELRDANSQLNTAQGQLDRYDRQNAVPDVTPTESSNLETTVGDANRTVQTATQPSQTPTTATAEPTGTDAQASQASSNVGGAIGSYLGAAVNGQVNGSPNVPWYSNVGTTGYRDATKSALDASKGGMRSPISSGSNAMDEMGGGSGGGNGGGTQKVDVSVKVTCDVSWLKAEITRVVQSQAAQLVAQGLNQQGK